jgi:hypothetical protein
MIREDQGAGIGLGFRYIEYATAHVTDRIARITATAIRVADQNTTGSICLFDMLHNLLRIHRQITTDSPSNCLQ